MLYNHLESSNFLLSFFLCCSFHELYSELYSPLNSQLDRAQPAAQLAQAFSRSLFVWLIYVSII